MQALLGDSLVRHDGSSVPTAEALGDAKYVGIYFSAHWCPPCRGFTPRLSAWADAHPASSSKLQLIFASNDKNEAEFKQYFGSMSWNLALPFKSSAINALGKKFKVEGIPTLVIVDAASGAVITTDGREGVVEDPEGAPWRAKTFAEIISSCPSVVDKSGASTPMSEVLSRKYVMLYFSAHWCPPCGQFTPIFAKWYEEFKASERGAELEVIFVSSDKSEDEWKGYMAEMPWKALPYADRKMKQTLGSRFKVQGIPTLILLDTASGEVLVSDARSRVGKDPTNFPWGPKPVERLDDVMDNINDKAFLIAFTDKLTDAAAEVAVHDAMTAAAGKPREDLQFVIAGESDEAAEQVRAFIGLGGDKDGASAVRVALLDIPNNCKYLLGEGNAVPTAAALTEFVAAYEKGTAKKLGVRAKPGDDSPPSDDEEE